eukprot:TRINITY_DN3363_c0_g1_i2.p1 TRINITY_DN3363_c0_g1~~TRINITY_DN3363_c0_g1_i2.p1  ORF type:complete len:295 (-),score=46.44 TRINITY_DN3363_c0_g1_i2:167-1051(-)
MVQRYPSSSVAHFSRSAESSQSVFVTSTVLGEGSTSQVVLGRTSEGKKVALKIVNKKFLSRPHQREEFFSELQVLKAVSQQNKNICSLLQVIEEVDCYKLVFEYFSCSLFDLCQTAGRLPEPEARTIFSQIVSAVDFLHNYKRRSYDGICHRDLKLENIMLSEDGKRVVVIDFGYSCFVRSGQLLNKQCGSFHYVAPEIVSQESYDGRKTDMWALGCILFALVTGYQPFDSDNTDELFQLIKMGHHESLPKDLSKEVVQLIKGLLETRPERRLTIERTKAHPWLSGSAVDNLLV